MNVTRARPVSGATTRCSAASKSSTPPARCRVRTAAPPPSYSPRQSMSSPTAPASCRPPMATRSPPRSPTGGSTRKPKPSSCCCRRPEAIVAYSRPAPPVHRTTTTSHVRQRQRLQLSRLRCTPVLDPSSSRHRLRHHPKAHASTTAPLSAPPTTPCSNGWAGSRSCSTTYPTGSRRPGSTPTSDHDATACTTHPALDPSG